MPPGGLRPAVRAHHLRAGLPGGPRTRRRACRMSLINDALRRASQAKPSPPTEDAVETPLRPADYPPRSPSWLYLALACLLLVLGGTGSFWLRGNKAAE